ncbi:MAG: hypothetical protein EA411_08205 [Saprospirales bacterium]|nr:MAG: hypothetical protein EA411_08205 [Saprospirales bacterium]
MTFPLKNSSKLHVKSLVLMLFIAPYFLASCGDLANRSNENTTTEGSFLASYYFSDTWLDISGETSNARATYWNPEGTMVYVVGRRTDNVVAYEVSEPWQVSMGSYYAEAELQGSNQHGLYFREDGEKMWIFDRTGIWTYQLSEPWNIQTLSEGNYTDFSEHVRRGHDIDFNPDGSRLFIDDRDLGAVFQYDLDSAWDVSTASLDYHLDISDIQREVRGLEFIEEGRLMLLMDTRRREILQFELTEPWEISTAEFTGVFDVSGQTPQGRGLSFSEDEEFFYVTCRNAGKIFQYQLYPVSSDTDGGN